MNIILEAIFTYFPMKRKRDQEQFQQLLRSIECLEKHDPDFVCEKMLPGLKVILQEDLSGKKWDVFHYREAAEVARKLNTSMEIATILMRGGLIVEQDGRTAVQKPRFNIWIIIFCLICLSGIAILWYLSHFLLSIIIAKVHPGASVLAQLLWLVIFVGLFIYATMPAIDYCNKWNLRNKGYNQLDATHKVMGKTL